MMKAQVKIKHFGIRVRFLLLAVIFLFATGGGVFAGSLEIPEISWQGGAYSGKVRIGLKDGRAVEGVIVGGVENQSVKIVPYIGSAGIDFPFSQIQSIEPLPYDKKLEDQADALVQQVSDAAGSASIQDRDSRNYFKKLDEAATFYHQALLLARQAEERKRIEGKISAIDELKDKIKQHQTHKTQSVEKDEHWKSVTDAKDRLDYARGFELLLVHVKKYPEDMRAHEEANKQIQKYETLASLEKENMALFAARYLHACSETGVLPDKALWKTLTNLFNYYLEALMQPGSASSLACQYYGAEAIISLLKKHESLRAELSPWSGKAVEKNPLDYLQSSAVNEVRRGHANAGEKVNLILKIHPGRESWELYAEWALNQRDISSALKAYQEIVKYYPAGDPKTERLINILNFLQDSNARISQGDLEKARDNLMRVWDKKDDLPPALIKMIYNMIAQCDWMILTQKMKDRQDLVSFYQFILERMAYFNQSSFAENFFDLFKKILATLPVTYDIKVISQGNTVIAPSGLVRKIRELVGSEDKNNSKLVLCLEVDLDVKKKLDREIITRKHSDSSSSSDSYLISIFLVTDRNVQGRYQLSAEGYGILSANAFRKSFRNRDKVGSYESHTSDEGLIPDPLIAKMEEQESPGDALYNTTAFLLPLLDESGLKPLSLLLKTVPFDPNRKISVSPQEK